VVSFPTLQLRKRTGSISGSIRSCSRRSLGKWSCPSGSCRTATSPRRTGPTCLLAPHSLGRSRIGAGGFIQGQPESRSLQGNGPPRLGPRISPECLDCVDADLDCHSDCSHHYDFTPSGDAAWLSAQNAPKVVDQLTGSRQPTTPTGQIIGPSVGRRALRSPTAFELDLANELHRLWRAGSDNLAAFLWRTGSLSGVGPVRAVGPSGLDSPLTAFEPQRIGPFAKMDVESGLAGSSLE
jgi:hypothetical protein